MTASTTTPQTAPTAEAIQQALAFLRNLAEQKSTSDDSGKTDSNSMFDSEIFKTIEAALKNTAETNAKSKTAPVEDEDDENEENVKCADGDDDKDDDEDDDEDNPFADDYYWSPGPEWKTIGLVAGGAALVGLGVLLHKLIED